MAFLLLLPLFLVAVAEIALFVRVGQWIGLGPTVLAVVATALLGAALLRAQGLGALRRAQAALDRRELPVKELFDGACILVGGLLLILPGFLTDALGLLLLLPPVRALLRLALRHSHLVRGAASGRSAGGAAYSTDSGRWPDGHWPNGHWPNGHWPNGHWRGDARSDSPWRSHSGRGNSGYEGPVIDADYVEIDPPDRSGSGRDDRSGGKQ